jgi:16S rRNA (cytosine967-C5)-methyltransferase
LVRRGGKTSAGRFVNGVLRTISRTRDRLSLPALPAAIHSPADRDLAIDALHIAGSHPRWLVERWIDRLGLDAASAWVAFNNAEAPLTLRVNRTRAVREAIAERLRVLGVETVPTRVAPDGLTVTQGNPLRTTMAASGDFLIQDEASQLVPLVVGARPGHRVLDACAAPGGKSLALADALQGMGLLVAADARDKRVALLRRVLHAHGAGASLVEHDLHAGAPFGPVFDRVLVDAPCTGLGTLRRDVDIRWRRAPEDLVVAARRQGRMLAEASAAVAPGGRLVYATCSSEPEENEHVVTAFLANHAGFCRVPAQTLIGEGLAAALLNPNTGELVTRPDHHGLECFYAAAVERVT